MTALADATFYAPLTSSGTLTNGSGTFTFARATTKKNFNAAGVLETVASGDIAFNADYGAHIDPVSKTNTLLWCRKLAGGGAVTNTINPWTSDTIGAELLTNPDFTANTVGWSVGGGSGTPSITWNAANGGSVDCVSGTSSNELIKQSVTLTAGKTYKVTVGWIASSGASGVYAVNGGITTGGRFVSGNSHLLFVASGGTTSIQVVGLGALATATLTSISLKESAVQVSQTGTGIDGTANSCSRLTFKAAGATILQTITAAATAACSGFWVKRITGTGTVEFTRDNVTWLDITSQLSTGSFYVAKIENTSVTNPVVGFRGGTIDDLIDVDGGLNHAGTQLCEPIFATTAEVTRAAESLAYQTSGNISDTTGTMLATFRPTYDSWPNGAIVGKASFGLLASASNSGVQAADGTNTVSGLAGTPTGQRKIGTRWSGSALQAFYEKSFGAAGSYDGSFNLATIAINPGAAGYIRDVAIFNSWLDDTNMPWHVASGGGGYVDGLVRYHKLLDAAQRAREDRKSELKDIPVSLKEKKAFKKKRTVLKLEIEKELKQEDFSFKDVESAVEEKGYKFNNLMYIMSLNILRQKAESRNHEKIAAEIRRIEGIIALIEYENERSEILSLIELIH